MPEDPGAEFDHPEDPQDLDPNIRAQLRQSRKVGREAEEAKARAATAERELAFVKAGIPEDGLGKLLRDSWTGDADAEAIKAKATEYGIPLGGQPAPDPAAGDGKPAPTEAELEALRRAQGAASGTTGAGPGARDFAAEIAAATSQDQVMALLAEAKSAGAYS